MARVVGYRSHTRRTLTRWSCRSRRGGIQCDHRCSGQTRQRDRADGHLTSYASHPSYKLPHMLIMVGTSPCRGGSLCVRRGIRRAMGGITPKSSRSGILVPLTAYPKSGRDGNGAVTSETRRPPTDLAGVSWVAVHPPRAHTVPGPPTFRIGCKGNGHKLRFRATCQVPAFPALRMSKGA